MNRLLKILTFTIFIIFTVAINAFSASSSTIDSLKTASLHIYKYDKTAVDAAQVDTSALSSTGEYSLSNEAALSAYAVEGVEFTYLKVSDIYFKGNDEDNQDNQVYMYYTISSELATILDTDTTVTSDEINTNLASILSSDNTVAKNALETYIKSNGGTQMTKTDSSGATSATDLDQGLYLVIETSVPENVYSTTNPFFVSLPMTNADGTDWNYDVYVYPKNQTDEPLLEKLVDGKTDTTASSGDTLTYRIIAEVPAVTSLASYLTEYEFIDTLAKGLTYNKDAVICLYDPDTTVLSEVEQGTATADITWDNDTYFTVTYNDTDNTMTINPTDAGLEQLNKYYSNYYLSITYTAKIKDDANLILGDNGNDNNVKLTYSRTNTDSYNTLEESATVYSYGIKITKEFDNSELADISKVKFIVQNSTTSNYLTASSSGTGGVYYVTGITSSSGDATQFTPNADGTLIIKGIKADTYIIEETATAEGFLLADLITIEIIATSESNGVIVGASAKVDEVATTMSTDTDSESINAYIDINVMNYKGVELPPTGGQGTYLYVIYGIILIVIGTVIIMSRSSKSIR